MRMLSIGLFSQDGGYTCKLGYRFLKEEDDLIPQEDVGSWDKLLWKGVRSLQSPNKIKNLMWRACRNSLPMKENLVRRTVLDDPVYDRSHAALETPLHALQLCCMV